MVKQSEVHETIVERLQKQLETADRLDLSDPSTRSSVLFLQKRLKRLRAMKGNCRTVDFSPHVKKSIVTERIAANRETITVLA